MKEKQEKKKLPFYALLSNVDDSILDISLDGGFKIRKEPSRYFTEKFHKLKRVVRESQARTQLDDWGCVKSDSVFFIYKEYEADATDLFASISFKFPNGELKYLYELMDKLKLLSEGNVHIATYFLLEETQGGLNSWFFGESIRPIVNEPYSLNEVANHQLKEIMGKSYSDDKKWRIALSYFLASYNVPSTQSSFLMCIIGLESLMIPSGNNELTYRLSRNIAVLLSKTSSDGARIFKRMKEIYSIRSKVLHTGETDDASKEVLFEARDYLRRCLLLLWEEKDVRGHLESLTFVGFGGKSVTS